MATITKHLFYYYYYFFYFCSWILADRSKYCPIDLRKHYGLQNKSDAIIVVGHVFNAIEYEAKQWISLNHCLITWTWLFVAWPSLFTRPSTLCSTKGRSGIGTSSRAALHATSTRPGTNAPVSPNCPLTVHYSMHKTTVRERCKKSLTWYLESNRGTVPFIIARFHVFRFSFFVFRFSLFSFVDIPLFVRFFYLENLLSVVCS